MATWSRSSVEFDTDPLGIYLPEIRPRLMLRTTDATGALRVGIWTGSTLLGGWRVPFLPSNTVVVIDGARATGYDRGVTQELRAWLRSYDDRLPDHNPTLPHGKLTLTLDQEPDRVVPVLIEITASQRGGG